MAQTLKKLGQGAFAVADGALYTTPAGTYAAITGIWITNTDTVERTFRLHQVNAAGSSAATNAIYYDFPIGSKRSFTPPIGIILEPGQMLRGLASATAVTYTIFGIEST